MSQVGVVGTSTSDDDGGDGGNDDDNCYAILLQIIHTLSFTYA